MARKKAKFRVGQVVAATDSFYDGAKGNWFKAERYVKLFKRKQFVGVWGYWVSKRAGSAPDFYERDLRPLTRRERGEQLHAK